MRKSKTNAREKKASKITPFRSPATVRKFDPLQRQSLTEFGQYCAECMPKFVQKVQLTAGDELELLIAPQVRRQSRNKSNNDRLSFEISFVVQGVVPVMNFLKGHHNAQFTSLADITAVDMPTRVFRFEVSGQDCRKTCKFTC